MSRNKLLDIIFVIAIAQTIAIAIWAICVISALDASAGLGVIVLGFVFGIAILYMLLFLGLLAWYSKRNVNKPTVALFIILDLIPISLLYYTLVWNI